MAVMDNPELSKPTLPQSLPRTASDNKVVMGWPGGREMPARWSGDQKSDFPSLSHLLLSGNSIPQT